MSVMPAGAFMVRTERASAASRRRSAARLQVPLNQSLRPVHARPALKSMRTRESSDAAVR